jgi:hypothetical protein
MISQAITHSSGDSPKFTRNVAGSADCSDLAIVPIWTLDGRRLREFLPLRSEQSESIAAVPRSAQGEIGRP